MDRRSFLKIGGAIATAGITGGCGQMAQSIIPYVTPPDEGINPVEGEYYYTVCGMCGSGCGIMVRTVSGRAKKIEGNPSHPVNHGGVCAMGQAAVWQLYHPERIKTPLKRDGAKGSNIFTPISWDEALGLLAENMEKARGKGSFVMADDHSDVVAMIATRVLQQLGSHDFAVPVLGGKLISADGPPVYFDLSKAACALLLGADIFENGFSQVHFGHAYGQLRRGDPTRRGMMIYAGPRLSMTAASADRFVSAKHGSLGTLALGIAARLIHLAQNENAATDSTMLSWMKRLDGLTVESASEKSGVPTETILEIASQLFNHAPAIAIAGDDVTAHSNGTQGLEAVDFLNSILSHLSGARRLWREEPPIYRKMREFAAVPSNATDYSATKEIIAKAARGEMSLGMILNTNPAHNLPGGMNCSGALEKTGFVAVFGCFLNDTTRHADIVLPSNHFLESWSAQVTISPSGIPVFNARQPVVRPLYSTAQPGDTLLRAAAMAGLPVEVESQEAMVMKIVEKLRHEWSGAPSTLTAKEAWEYLLQRGGWWPEVNSHAQAQAHTPRNSGPIAIEAPVFSAKPGHTFHLHPYQTMPIGAGGAANMQWLQEMPEPMSTISWGHWVEINPKTAVELGVSNGDILKIETPHGALEVPAYLYPGVGPDTLAIPFGYGHESFGKHASGRGANAMKLIEDTNWRGVMAKITKTGRKTEFVMAGNPRGDYEGRVFQL
ncbi:MAG: molybdopterin-dependent oxidoreductase [Nitrospinae bacterium]|nr:molybdopterin-dependent oxidoreductase [Nitrospinota bacterium]